MDDLIDGMLVELQERDVVYIPDSEAIDEQFLQPLGHILAHAAAPEFGSANDQGLLAYKMQAERDLRQMSAIRYTRKIGGNDYF